MKKRFLASILAGCMALSLAACSSSSSSGEAESIKIGVLLSTTGGFSISETPMRNAAEMAINEINEAGGINGVQIEPIYMDYNSDPSMAAEKAQELILKEEVVAIIGTNSSSTRLAVEPIIEQYDSLLVYNTFYEGEAPSDNVLYTNTVPSQQVDGFMPFILENLGKKIYFVGSDYEFPINTIEYAKALLEASGGEIVGEDYAPSGSTDFSSIVNKIKAAEPDVIFSAVAGNDSVYFYDDCDKYGIDVDDIALCSVAAHEATVKGLGEAAIGTYACFSYFNTLTSDENQEFVSKYVDLFGTDTTVNNGAACTYSGVYLLANSIEAAGSYDAADIVAAAAGMEVDTPAGTIQMDETNHHAWLNTYVGKVNENLEFDIVSSSDGLVAPIVD
ncbi:MAG: transporter substrate-binding protein [Clostridia bacterium]